MFTGLIREVGEVARVATAGGVTILDIHAPGLATGLAVGDSLAVDGICLTVTAIAGRQVRVDASFETQRVTTLASWRRGTPVHLEPSLRVGDAIGGHFVLGHVDGVGTIRSLDRERGVVRMTVSVPAPLRPQLLPKGSVAVDGVSLTLDQGPFHDRFTVTLIPHTLASTHFARQRVGDHVNLETDILAKSAAARPSIARPATRPLTLDAIRALGWTR